MRLVVTVKELRYAAKQMTEGDEFETESDTDAVILKAIGKAKDAPAKAAPQKTTGTTKNELPMQTTSVEATKADDVELSLGNEADSRPTGRRRYMRRDMTATEE